MKIFFSVLFVFVLAYLISQLIGSYILGCFKRVRGIYYDYLKKELSINVRLTGNGQGISLKFITPILGLYVDKQTYNLFFPYVLYTNDCQTFGILRYSKAYYLVKNKFKELENK